MRPAGRTGVLGGTFDPIHVGHLAAAEAARSALDLDEVILLPSNVPPHRPRPIASTHQRFAMVALAITDRPALRVSELELVTPGPSYTAATLARLHALGYAPSQLFFITGADAFAEIATWRDYPAFLDAANFVVIDRGSRRASEMGRVLPELDSRMAGVAPDRSRPASDPPARQIFLVDYSTPDVSSTGVRERIADGRPLAGLVPGTVEQFIRRHRLYSADTTDPSRPTGHGRASLLHEQEHR
jgi:nicotinate-nucleotide adenylyltransferase